MLIIRNVQSAMQRLEEEREALLCQMEQQQQDYRLQTQYMQQACQDTVQCEKERNAQQVKHQTFKIL